MSDAGWSTCPICKRTWLVTPDDDCLMPACGHYGYDASAGNPDRPCQSCGLSHAWFCRAGDTDGDTTGLHHGAQNRAKSGTMNHHDPL